MHEKYILYAMDDFNVVRAGERHSMLLYVVICCERKAQTTLKGGIKQQKPPSWVGNGWYQIGNSTWNFNGVPKYPLDQSFFLRVSLQWFEARIKEEWVRTNRVTTSPLSVQCNCYTTFLTLSHSFIHVDKIADISTLGPQPHLNHIRAWLAR